MENKKKEKNIPKIIVSIVLICLILFLGYISYNRFYLKPDKNSVTYEIPESKNLVEGNTFSLNGIICKEKTNTVCLKELKVSFNNENHMIKIKRVKKVSSSVSIKHEIYIDEKLLDTIDGGVIYDEEDKSKIDFDGYILIGENKYLIFVTPFNIENTVNYVVTYYDGTTKLGRSFDIINGEQKICKDSCDSNDSEILNNLEALEFDGKTLKYWKSLCTSRDKEALQIGITVINEAVTTKYLDTENDVEIKGACS